MNSLETISKFDPDVIPIILDAIFTENSSGLAVIDPAYRYLWVNPAFASYNGVPAEAHAGRSVHDVIGEKAWSDRHPFKDSSALGRDSLEQLLSCLELSIQSSKSGVKTSYVPLYKDRDRFGVLVMVVDPSRFIAAETELLQRSIEERKVHEQRVMEQEERLKLVLRSGKLGTWQVSLLREELIDASAVCKATFGYGPDEHFDYHELVKSIHPEDIDAVLKAVDACRKSGCEYQIEYRSLWRDGSVHWVSATAQPTFDENGKPITLIGISQDISHRKQEEREKSELLAKIRDFAVMQAAFLRDVLASVTDGKLRLCQSKSELPERGSPLSEPIKLTTSSGLNELRRAAKRAAVDLDFSDERWQDLITAVSEAGMNAVVHAGGGNAQVFEAQDGCVQVWVSDQGKGINLENLPRATLEKGYTTTGTMGHGMKMMLQTGDRVWLLTGPAGTTLVIEQDGKQLKREWL